MIHGGHLRAAVPLPRLGLGVDGLLAGHQGRDGVGVAAVRQREDALAHLDAQIPGMTVQAPGRPVLERRVDIPFPQVGGLHRLVVWDEAGVVDPASAPQHLVEPEPARLGDAPGLEEFTPRAVSVYSRPLEHQDSSPGACQDRCEGVASDATPNDDNLKRFARKNCHRLLQSTNAMACPFAIRLRILSIFGHGAMAASAGWCTPEPVRKRGRSMRSDAERSRPRRRSRLPARLGRVPCTSLCSGGATGRAWLSSRDHGPETRQAAGLPPRVRPRYAAGPSGRARPAWAARRRARIAHRLTRAGASAGQNRCVRRVGTKQA